jgi:hypothetical protein
MMYLQETVSTAMTLGLNPIKQINERSNLSRIRASHKEQVIKLEKMARERKTENQKVLNTETLLAELRKGRIIL